METLESLLPQVLFLRTLELTTASGAVLAVLVAGREHVPILHSVSLTGAVDVTSAVEALPIRELSVRLGTSPLLRSDTITSLEWERTDVPALDLPQLEAVSARTSDATRVYDSLAAGRLPKLRAVRHDVIGPYLAFLERPEVHGQLRSLRIGSLGREHAAEMYAHCS